jgi:hypothetical protein
MGEKWLKIEDVYLLNEYSKGKKEVITKHLGRTWATIQCRASKLGVKRIDTEIRGRNVRIWDDVSITYLMTNYEMTNKDELIEYLGRSWSSIQNKAFLLNLKRDVSNADVNKLINGCNESYYWLGFIMADGHFSLSKQIQINLAKKDLEHLMKFADFVGYKGKINKPRININYSKINNWLLDTFNISNNKTYNPCNLNNLSGDKFFSFIIGFIDGDGTINKKGYLYIKCHKSWLDNLNKMVSFLTNGDFNKGRINVEGLALVQLTKIEHMKSIKEKSIILNLPILARKWSRVNETKYSKKELSLKNFNSCRDLFRQGFSVREVVEITKLSLSQVYKQKQLIMGCGDGFIYTNGA